MMHVYLNSEPGLWTVGYYKPDGEFYPLSDHSEEREAAVRVHYLNGGSNTVNAELLEACKAMLARWEQLYPFDHQGPQHLAHAAISKAEGGAS